jgi:hypothetical protein
MTMSSLLSPVIETLGGYYGFVKIAFRYLFVVGVV